MDFFKRLFGFDSKTDGKVEFAKDSTNNEEVDINDKAPVPQFLAEKYPWLENAFRIQEGDCTSCKYIGSGFSYGVCIYLLTQLRYPPKEAFHRKGPFYATVISLTSVFFILGTSRLFDIGISAPQPKDSPKNILQLAYNDFQDLKKYVNKISGKVIFQEIFIGKENSDTEFNDTEKFENLGNKLKEEKND